MAQAIVMKRRPGVMITWCLTGLAVAGPALSALVPMGAGAALVVLAAAGAAHAQSAEALAREAQAITVRLEGATQGSGVLVKREGNRYPLCQER